jgi:hypothetical protein
MRFLVLLFLFFLDVPVVFPSHAPPPHDVVIGRTPTLRSICLLCALTGECLRGKPGVRSCRLKRRSDMQARLEMDMVCSAYETS